MQKGSTKEQKSECKNLNKAKCPSSLPPNYLNVFDADISPPGNITTDFFFHMVPFLYCTYFKKSSISLPIKYSFEEILILFLQIRNGDPER